MASEMVMAIGDSGHPELTAADECIEIKAYPLGPGNTMIPATVRHNVGVRGGGIPTRLLQVRRPTERNGLPFVHVRYQCTPFPRYVTEKEEVALGYEWGCYIRNAEDAQHEIFANFTERERARLQRAVAAR